MRRLATLLSSIAFLVAGILLSGIGSDVKQNQLHAANPYCPELPLDLQLKTKTNYEEPLVVRDTVVLRDTVQVETPVVKYKYRVRKHVVKPDTLPVVKHDTLYVPSLYVVIQTDANLPADTIVKAIRDVEE